MPYKKYPVSLKQNFGIQGHNMRNKFDLHTRYCSTVLCQRSATNMGVKLFNKLPAQIKQLDNYEDFKREGKTFLLNNSFYMTEEFFAL